MILDVFENIRGTSRNQHQYFHEIIISCSYDEIHHKHKNTPFQKCCKWDQGYSDLIVSVMHFQNEYLWEKWLVSVTYMYVR